MKLLPTLPRRFLVATFWVLSWIPAVAGQPPAPTVIYLGDGDDVTFRQHTRIPVNWMMPSALLNWPTAPGGFGSSEHFSEVSTPLDFSIIHLRKTFTINSGIPSTLTLTLKSSEGPVNAYLNGDLVLSQSAEDLPPADEMGFRSFDLSAHIDKLASSGSNLFALQVSGDLVIPILHGTLIPDTRSFLTVDVRKTRLAEGGLSSTVRLSSLSSSGQSVSIYLSSRNEIPLRTDDFEIRQNGLLLPIIDGPSPRFLVGIPSGSQSAEFEIHAVNDEIAEEQKVIGLTTVGAFVPEIAFPISRNDTAVTNSNPSGEGSLKQAIENANIIPGPQTVNFSDSEGIPFSEGKVVIDLDPGSLTNHFNLKDDVIIEGPSSPGRVILDGNGIGLFYMFRPNVTLRRMVLRNADVALDTVRYIGELLVEDCEFIGNTTALDLYSLRSPIQVRRCLVTESSRNAITNSYGLPPVLTNCTIASNNGETAVSSSRSLVLNSCTVAHNHRAVSGTVIARNSLFTEHPGGFKLVNHTEFDAGGNLFESRTGTSIFPLNPLSRSGTPEAPLDPMLGELGYHGGFTRTIPILKSSPALDLGLPPTAGSPPTDQRGIGFARRVGPVADAGAFEVQFAPSDLSPGAVTSVSYDANAGIYFQLVVIHNNSPWDLAGFRISPDELPDGVTLYNSTGFNQLDVGGGIGAGDFRIIVLQYFSDRSDLLINPQLKLGFLPGSDLPIPPSMPSQNLRISFDESNKVRLDFQTEAGRNYEVECSDDLKSWRSGGPILWAESGHLIWHESSPRTESKYYRVKETN